MISGKKNPTVDAVINGRSRLSSILFLPGEFTSISLFPQTLNLSLSVMKTDQTFIINNARCGICFSSWSIINLTVTRCSIVSWAWRVVKQVKKSQFVYECWGEAQVGMLNKIYCHCLSGFANTKHGNWLKSSSNQARDASRFFMSQAGFSIQAFPFSQRLCSPASINIALVSKQLA